MEPCEDSPTEKVFLLFGVEGCTLATDVGQVPCDAVRFGTVLAELCPLSCRVCDDNSESFYNVTSLASRAQVDIMPVPPPIVTLARFLTSGSTVEIKFDRPTNNARMQTHDCSQVLASVHRDGAADLGLRPFGIDPTCVWLDQSTFHINIGTYTRHVAMVVPGDLLTLRHGAVLNIVENSFAAAGNILLAKPITPLVPSAVLNVPTFS